MDDLAKRRGASDELQKIIADVDAIKFRVDDILDVHKNDPSLISDDLRKTTLKKRSRSRALVGKEFVARRRRRILRVYRYPSDEERLSRESGKFVREVRAVDQRVVYSML